MSEKPPIACSLEATELATRFDLIATIGAKNLISRDTDGGTHLLRFRRDDQVRRSLEDIVAAETECCPFLDMEIRDEPEAVVLLIGSPDEGAPIAAELAAAFATR